MDQFIPPKKGLIGWEDPLSTIVDAAIWCLTFLRLQISDTSVAVLSVHTRYIWRFPKNRGTHEWSILIGFSNCKPSILDILGVHPFMETPIIDDINETHWFIDSSSSLRDYTSWDVSAWLIRVAAMFMFSNGKVTIRGIRRWTVFFFRLYQVGYLFNSICCILLRH